MAPKPLDDLRKHVEETQSQYDDPAERERALGTIETGLTNLLGVTRTYRNDARLQIQGEGTERSSDRPGEKTTRTPEASDPS